MHFAIDTHVHLYECYNFSQLFIIAKKNFEKLFPDFVHVVCFTERAGEDYLGLLKEKQIDFVKIDDLLIKINLSDNKCIYGLLGKQIITKEKIEVLGLGLRGDFRDGDSIREIVQKLRKALAVSILPWGFGKWLGARRKIVFELLSKNSDLMIGDIPQRSELIKLLEKLLLRSVRSEIPALYGSDPLPVKGEEELIGTFGLITKVDEGNTENITGEFIKDLLVNSQYTRSNFGHRNSTSKAFKRFLASTVR